MISCLFIIFTNSLENTSIIFLSLGVSMFRYSFRMMSLDLDGILYPYYNDNARETAKEILYFCVNHKIYKWDD